MSLVDDELDRRMTEAFAGLDDITVLRASDAPARRRSRVRPVLLAVGCAAALAAAVVVVASRRGETPVRQTEATVSTPSATKAATPAPATTPVAPPVDRRADRHLAHDGVVQRGDVPSGLGFKGTFAPHAAGCFGVAAHPTDRAAGASGRQYIGDRGTASVVSVAWSYPDPATAQAALETIATIDTVDCFGKGQVRLHAPTVKYLGADTLPFPTVGDATVAFRFDYQVDGANSAGNVLFVRTGRVVTSAAFQQIGGAPEQSAVKAMLERGVARVRNDG